jgi:hypothetical protein
MFTSRSPQKNKRSLPIGWEKRTSNNVDIGRVYYTNGRQRQWNFPTEPERRDHIQREESGFFAPKRDPSFSTPFLANQYTSPEVRTANRAREDQIDAWARQYHPTPSFSTPFLANQYTSPEVRTANRAWENQNDAWARQHHATPSLSTMRDAEMDALARRQRALEEYRRETQQRTVEQQHFRSEQERERRNETPAQRQNRLDFEQIKTQRDELYNDRVRVALEIQRHESNGTTSDDSYHEALRERNRLEKVDDDLMQSLLYKKNNPPL